MNAPASLQQDDRCLSLEAVEFELSLQGQDIAEHGFEDAVRRAIEAAGGEMLFHMRMDGETGCQRIAAVAIGAGEERQFAIVSLPEDGGAVRVEPAEKSGLPIARIAAAYAGVMDRLQAAA